jgi:hypothetical protein
MDYRRELEKLERFRALLEHYDPVKFQSGDDNRHLKYDLVEAYGAIEEVVERFVGRNAVAVPAG